MLGLLFGVSDDPVVRVERCKLVASGCQLIAIGILGAAIIAPIFNTSVNPPPLLRGLGGVAATMIELLALRLLGYVGSTVKKGETGDG